MKRLNFAGLALVLVFLLLSTFAPAQTAAAVLPAKKSPIAKHALAKTFIMPAKAAVFVAKKSGAIALTGIKDTIGGVLFLGEEGVDATHLVTSALAKGTGDPEYFPKALNAFFVKADGFVAKADTGLEKGELFFFGRSE